MDQNLSATVLPVLLSRSVETPSFPGTFPLMASPAWLHPAVTLRHGDGSKAWRVRGTIKREATGRTDGVNQQDEGLRPCQCLKRGLQMQTCELNERSWLVSEEKHCTVVTTCLGLAFSTQHLFSQCGGNRYIPLYLCWKSTTRGSVLRRKMGARDSVDRSRLDPCKGVATALCHCGKEGEVK